MRQQPVLSNRPEIHKVAFNIQEKLCTEFANIGAYQDLYQGDVEVRLPMKRDYADIDATISSLRKKSQEFLTVRPLDKTTG